MWIAYVIGALLGVWIAILMHRRDKRREDKYFKRMEEAFRNANENKDKNK